MDNKAAIFITDFPWPLNWVTVDLQNLLAEYSHNNYACIIILLGSFFFFLSPTVSTSYISFSRAMYLKA